MRSSICGRNSWASLILLVIFVFSLQVFLAQGQSVPKIGGCPSELYYPEGLQNGTVLFTLTANVSAAFPTMNVTWSIVHISTSALVHVDIQGNGPPAVGQSFWTANVTLTGVLDRDFEPSKRPLTFRAMDSSGQSGEYTCQIVITDINDNPPSFQGLPYNIQIPENTVVGALLKEGISSVDPDTGLGGTQYLSAQFSDPTVEPVFNLSKRIVGTGEVMDIILAQPLNRETRSFYSFQLMATDKALNTTTEVRVTVTDVQDTPPFFLLDSYRAAIQENRSVGTHVIKVSAEDGDRDPPNSISYSFVNGSRTDLFAIDKTTGQITSLVVLDRDDETMVGRESMFQLIVRATENNDTWPQYGNTTTDALVVIMVEDVNDNSPTFNSSMPYTAFVRRDIPAESLIYFDGEGYIHVTDLDQGKNSLFNLTVERNDVPWPALEASPAEAYSEARVLLRVKDPDVFRNAQGKHITLQLVAREVSTTERFSSTAMVVITVEEEEAPPTAAPVEQVISESDVVVFIIGFLVIFNIVASVLIIYFMRKRARSEPRQGLVRKGSKYYVNGVEKTVAGGGQNGASMTYGEDTVMVEVEGKDRCDVVPLSAVLSETGKPWGDSTEPNSAGNRASSSSFSQAVNFGEILENGNSLNQTDRKALLAHEAATPGSTSTITLAGGNVSVTSAATITNSPASAAIPNMTKAKRNISMPQNPALAFSYPQTGTTAPSPSENAVRASHLPERETTIFPPLGASASSATAAAAPASTTSASRPVSLYTTNADASSQPTTVEPVTRFSSVGVVSTTIAAVPSAGRDHAGTENDAAGKGSTAQVQTTSAKAELLY